MPKYQDGDLNDISEVNRVYYEGLQTENAGFISYAKDSTNYIPVKYLLLGLCKDRQNQRGLRAGRCYYPEQRVYLPADLHAVRRGGEFRYCIF